MPTRLLPYACAKAFALERISAVQSQSKLLIFGGQGRDRTADTRIFSPLLYQLSYLAGKPQFTTSVQNSCADRPWNLIQLALQFEFVLALAHLDIQHHVPDPHIGI